MKFLHLRVIIGTTSLALLMFLLAPAFATDAGPAKPVAFQDLINCRAIADDVVRWACLDEKVAKFEEAEARGEVVVVDKKQVKAARKGLFGLTLPDLSLFGGKNAAENDPDQDGISRIESTIKSARLDAQGKWLITLEDGARWAQVERDFIPDPKAGQPIVIRKAALGGFLGNINKRPAIRMRRVN